MKAFELLFRPEAVADLAVLPKTDQEQILRVIRERLPHRPASYGKPLSSPLKGLRRIRVGSYRIAYQIIRNTVILWAIKHRKEIYEELEKRYGP